MRCTMPQKPKRPCSKPGCRDLVDKHRYCKKHQRESDKRRGTSASRGYGHRWRLARDRYLAEHQLCVACMQSGTISAATVVDHIKAHKGNEVLFWSEANWQALCSSCHSRKTVQEDGGFGR
ncbi:HNH endonuclease [Paenibacillus sp. 598K]|uniref:HNH endonuclease n=1 Tax=Paenibacillus sp. 598K TaxID=1117987 RepID=UPI0027D85364|nr:HNH endonuclease [Paenibacillus sp. 598K]